MDRLSTSPFRKSACVAAWKNFGEEAERTAPPQRTQRTQRFLILFMNFKFSVSSVSSVVERFAQSETVIDSVFDPETACSVARYHSPSVAFVSGLKLPLLRSDSRTPSTDGGRAVSGS